MKNFKFLITFLAIVLLCSCTNKTTYKNINYIEISKKDSQNSYHGLVKSNLSTILSFQSEGKLIFLPYSKGDFVKKGQVIARLDGALYNIKKNEELQRLQEAKVNLDKQKSYYKRMDVLHKAGAISDNDWENAYFELKSLEKEIEIEKEKVNYLNKQISYNIIIAPYDGYISQKFCDIGAILKESDPVVELINSQGFQVEIMVNQKNISGIKLNQEVKVTILDKIYDGTISHIAKSSLNEGGFIVKISLQNSSSLYQGMSADVEIENEKNNFTLPLKCVYREDEQGYIYKIIDIKDNIGKIEKEKIELGKIQNENVEVLKGLNYFDKVVCDSNVHQNNEKVRL